MSARLVTRDGEAGVPRPDLPAAQPHRHDRSPGLPVGEDPVVDKLRVVPNLTYWLTEPDGEPEQVQVLSTTVHPDPTNPRVLIRSVDGDDHSEREVDAKFLSGM